MSMPTLPNTCAGTTFIQNPTSRSTVWSGLDRCSSTSVADAALAFTTLVSWPNVVLPAGLSRLIALMVNATSAAVTVTM